MHNGGYKGLQGKTFHHPKSESSEMHTFFTPRDVEVAGAFAFTCFTRKRRRKIKVYASQRPRALRCIKEMSLN
eukprot:157751-Pelagomonas_calceolata.AAC.2